jgi:hypothetical protein
VVLVEVPGQSPHQGREAYGASSNGLGDLRHDAEVDTSGDPRRRVAELLGDNPNVDAGSQGQRRGHVPEVVQPPCIRGG